MPDRIVRATILTSDAVDKLSAEGEVFYRRLLSVVDDFGRYDARPTILLAHLYPLRAGVSVFVADIERWLAENVAATTVQTYVVDGKPYVYVPKLGTPRAKGSKWPDPPANTCMHVHADANMPAQPSAPASVCEHATADVPYSYSYSNSLSYPNSKEQVRLEPGAPPPDPEGESTSIDPQPPEPPPPADEKVNRLGARLAPTWTLPDEWRDWALTERPDWNSSEVERVALVFRDHWHGLSGKEARKADWFATWRNWVRKERRHYGQPRASPTAAERRGSSMDAVIARGNGNAGRVINGSAERVDRAALRAVPGDLWEPGGRDVRVDGDDGGAEAAARGQPHRHLGR